MTTITIVMACENVQKAGKEIILNCYLYQDQIDSLEARQELLAFCDYAKHLIPTFSAAGFFTLNQHTLSSLFTALITYLIIIIQFNMAT